MSLLRSLKNLQLGIKLNIVLLVLLGILLASILYVMRSSVSNLITQIGRQRVLQETEIAQHHFVELQEELLKSAKILAGRSDLIEPVINKDDNLKTIVLIGGATLDLDKVTIVDDTGNPLIDADPMTEDNKKSLFALGLLGIDTVGAVTDELEFYHAAVVPLRDTKGSLIGSLLVENLVDNEFLHHLSFSREGVDLVLIHGGEVLAQTLNLPVDALDQVAIQQAINGGQTVVTDDIVNIDGISYVVAYSPLTLGGNVEGVMAVLLDINNLVVFENQLTRNTSLVFYGLGLVTIILLTLFIWRVILVPIRQLQNTAEQMAGGDYASRIKVRSGDEMGRLAQAFNQMADDVQTQDRELRNLTNELRQQMQTLETVTETSRRLVTILDVDQLLREVVNSIQHTFDYYHVHIYLLDRNTEELIMREGTGEIGRQLKFNRHKLQPGQGIVGQVVNSGEPLIVTNVDEDPDFVRNPLLPKTRSELAVPVRKGNIILGVLDIQSDEVDGFGHADATLMQSIADQVAVALENARLFREVRDAVSEAETLNRRLTRQSWSQVDRQASVSGYVFSKTGALPVTSSIVSGQTNDHETWLPIMTKAMQKKGVAVGERDAPNCLSVPLMLRNEVIGVIALERVEPEKTDGAKTGKHSQNVWSEDEVTTVQAVAEQISLALDSARLSRETERAAWRDRVVSESTAKLWATSEIEEVMKAAVAQLGDQLQASEVVIRLGKEEDLFEE